MNSKPPTNWIDLPMETRSKCIKWMSFKSRMCLRATSRTEKSLVESAPKIHFDSVVMNLTDANESRYQKFLQILKFTDVDNFEVSLKLNNKREMSDLFNLSANVAKFAPFRFKKLESTRKDRSIALFLLKNCSSVENLVLTGGNDEFCNIPAVVKAKRVQFNYAPTWECFDQLIAKWIEDDVEIGKTIQIMKTNCFAIPLDHNRVVSRNSAHQRIRTDNPAKHILVRWYLQRSNSYYTAQMIPAGQKKSEWENEEQWMEEFESKAHNKLSPGKLIKPTMDSKFEKWSELPTKMRMECVKWMNFRTRMMLRATSHTEKSLVESAPKYNFEFFQIDSGNREEDYLNIQCEQGVVCINPVEHYQLMIQVFKYASVEDFEIRWKLENDDDANKFISDISSGAPFRFQEFLLFTDNLKVAQFFLRNSEFEELNLHKANYNKDKFSIKDFIGIPAVINAKCFQLFDEQTSDDALMFIEKWIENDVEIDFGFSTAVSGIDVSGDVGIKFENRIIEKRIHEGNSWFRIRTDNESKHISIKVSIHRGTQYIVAGMIKA